MEPDAATQPARPPRRAVSWWRRARPVVLLVFSALAIYVLLPSLLAVFGEWRSLKHLEWPFAILSVASQAASYICLWELQRIALRTRAWLPVMASQLSGNALSHVVPSAAPGGALQASMLIRTGLAPGETIAALGATAALQWAATSVLPVLALPAILGGAPVDRRLDVAAYLGAGVLVLLIAVGVAALATDVPLIWAGRALQALLNATVRRHNPVTDLTRRLLANRDLVRTTLGTRWKAAVLAAAGNTGFDYFSLLAALIAVGAEPRPSLVLLAFVTAKLLTLLSITPDGLGFVEAGLVGTLTVAGVAPADALAATLLYRIVSYWLPLPAGGIAYLLFRRRYGRRRS